MDADPALGLITNLLEVPGLDAARHGLLVDVTAFRPRSVTADYTAAQEMVLLCDATAGAITLYLPPVDGNAGRVYFVKKTDASANAVTVDGNGAETIDGVASVALSVTFGWIGLVCDGVMWHRISCQAAQTFLALTDTPSSLAGQALKGLRVNAGETAIEFFALLSTFLALTDTPSSFTAQGKRQLRVNTGGTAVEFSPLTLPVIRTSLMTNTDQDTETDATYADCAGTASITIGCTCTLVIVASFRHRVDNISGTSSVKLVDSADATLGGVIRATAETGFQFNQITARISGVVAGTYTFNLMHVISNAAYNSYTDDKQILITAYPEVVLSGAELAYIDGDVAGCEWTGTAHASTSRRILTGELNLVGNPSLETNTTGYTASGSSIAQITTEHQRGWDSLEVTPADTAGDDGVLFGFSALPMPLGAGLVYSASVDFKAAAPGSYKLFITNSSFTTIASLSFSGTTSWTRPELIFSPGGTGNHYIYVTRNGAGPADVFYIDGLQLKEI